MPVNHKIIKNHTILSGDKCNKNISFCFTRDLVDILSLLELNVQMFVQ